MTKNLQFNTDFEMILHLSKNWSGFIIMIIIDNLMIVTSCTLYNKSNERSFH